MLFNGIQNGDELGCLVATVDIAPAKAASQGSHSSEEDTDSEDPSNPLLLLPQVEVCAEAVVAEPVSP